MLLLWTGSCSLNKDFADRTFSCLPPEEWMDETNGVITDECWSLHGWGKVALTLNSFGDIAALVVWVGRLESTDRGAGKVGESGSVGETSCETSGRFFDTFLAYFSRRFSTKSFRGVTDAMGTEGAEECWTSGFVEG